MSFSAEKKSVFLMFGGGLACPQVVPVKVSMALLWYFIAVSVLGVSRHLMQDESRTFWLGGESVNAGTEVLTMKCHG